MILLGVESIVSEKKIVKKYNICQWEKLALVSALQRNMAVAIRGISKVIILVITSIERYRFIEFARVLIYYFVYKTS